MKLADSIKDKLIEKVQLKFQKTPACHDWDHTERVRKNALHLAKLENADQEIVEFAALLHDYARPEELECQGKLCHAQLGSTMVKDVLREIGVDDNDLINHISECVRTHRYRKRHPDSTPVSLEAKIIYDADKLDSIGAIGIGRSFHFAGRVGARLHNTEEEAVNSASYSREDTAYREYLVKLRYIHDSMLTPSGNKIAESRYHFMVTFFERLNLEAEGLDF